jgi:hypothetical protein
MRLLNINFISIHNNFNYVAKKSLVAYLTDIVLSLQGKFCHIPAIIWGTLLPTKNSTSYIYSSAKSSIFLKHLMCNFIWYVILGFANQKYKN